MATEPSVTIAYPSDGYTLTFPAAVNGTAAPGDSGSPIRALGYQIGGGQAVSFFGRPGAWDGTNWRLTLQASDVPPLPGAYTLTVHAGDEANRSASASVNFLRV